MFVLAAIIGAVASIGGAIMQKKAADKAARRQEQLAREAARNKAMEAEEMARRAKLENAAEESRVRARAAASGLTGAGSIGDYLMTQQEENKRQLDWIRTAGRSEADYIRQSGYYQADATRAQGTAALFSGASQAAGIGMNYWAR